MQDTATPNPSPNLGPSPRATSPAPDRREPASPTSSDSSKMSVDPPRPASQAAPTPQPPPSAPTVWELTVFDIFSLRKEFTVVRDEASNSPAIDLLRHGYVAKTPRSPQYAVHVRTLELLYSLRQYKASFSVEAFAKVVCKFYSVRL